MSDVKAIKNAYLIDGTGKDPIENATIIIEGNKIAAVGKGSEINIPSDAQILDAAGKTVMPGMIESHYHLYGIDDPTEQDYPSTMALTISMLKARPTLLVLHSARNARRLLEAGYTAARDLGGFTQWDNTAIVDLKKAIELNLVPGPRLMVAGWMAPTAGHGAPQQGMASSWLMKVWTPDSSVPASDGVAEIRKRVRQLHLLGVDLIKTVASGGGGEGGFTVYTPEELKALVDEAHALGKKVAVHAYHAEDIKAGLRAGVDTIEHCAYPDDETIKMLVEKNAIASATLMTASERYYECRKWLRNPISDAAKAQRMKDLAFRKECFQKMLKAGVKIAAGGDVYFILMPLHGQNAYELELLVGFGMTPMQAIIAATKNGAECLGLLDKIGTLETGKLADIIIVQGNPLKDIKVLQPKENIRMVIKDGIIQVNRGI
jgi:imidazolonepropionase-like amidohydrolase